jgi:hypothetical protein
LSKLKPVCNLNKKSTVGIVPVNCTVNSCARKKTHLIFQISHCSLKIVFLKVVILNS